MTKDLRTSDFQPQVKLNMAYGNWSSDFNNWGLVNEVSIHGIKGWRQGAAGSMKNLLWESQGKFQ